MEDLERNIASSDFGVLVCTKDDKVTNTARRVNTMAPRDNVILELGMCIGQMGRKRAFLVKPKGRDIKIPSDLLGITLLEYDDSNPKVAEAIKPACEEIEKAILDGRNRSSSLGGWLAGWRSCGGGPRDGGQRISVGIKAFRFTFHAVLHIAIPLVCQVKTTQFQHRLGAFRYPTHSGSL